VRVVNVSVAVDIDRPAVEVFAYLANAENNPRWQKGMKHAAFTSEPPLRVGSTYDQVAEFLGREIRSSFEVVALAPGRSLTIATTESTFPIRVTRSVEPLGESRCRASAHVSGDPAGVYRLAAPVMRWLVARSVRRDYGNLKTVLEAS
jgi:uncharacterized protein YndB with AHSA1/START domain